MEKVVKTDLNVSSVEPYLLRHQIKCKNSGRIEVLGILEGVLSFDNSRERNMKKGKDLFCKSTFGYFHHYRVKCPDVSATVVFITESSNHLGSWTQW